MTLTYARSTAKEWCEAAHLSTLRSPDPLAGRRIALGTMELCQLALVARRKTSGPAGRIGRVEATKQSSVFISVSESLAGAAALEAYGGKSNRRHGRLADI